MSNLESTPPGAPSLAASSRTTGALRLRWAVNVALGIFVVACGSEDGSPGTGTGTGGAVGTTGGVVGSGGTPAAATGGTKATPTGGVIGSGGGGAAATGGTAPTGGTTGGGGQAGGAGGASTGGSGGGAGNFGGKSGGTGGASTTGGTGPTGGTAGTATGGSSSGAPSGGASAGTGGAASGTCQKGTTKGNEVLFIGESFIAASGIPEETTKLAIAAGALKSGESYTDKSVSGTWIGNSAGNSIPNQYKNNSSGVRFVLMNGGGNDCWQGGAATDRTNALNAAKSLFQSMGTNGVEKVVYFFYPDPIGAQHANLTACLDLLRPDMKAVCDAQTSPKCYWVDLRETWDGHNNYAATDGIHCAPAGEAPTAGAIFASMQANCVAP